MLGSAVRRRATQAQYESEERERNRPAPLDSKEIVVRPLEIRDCYRVCQLVHDVMYLGTGKSITLDVLQGKFFLASVAAVALCVYLIEENTTTMVLGNVWFFSSIAFSYWFMLNVICKRHFYSGADTAAAEEEFHEYWSNSAEGRYMWVAEVKGKVVGAAGVANTSPTAATIRRIMVLPEYQQRGVGSQLMLTLLDSCVRRKIDEIEAVISYRQKSAQKMFKKFGFRTKWDRFYQIGVRPFFKIKLARYVLSLEKIE